MDDEGIVAVDVKRDVMDEYNAALQETLAGVEVWQAGCHGYYRVPSGRIVTQWPGSMIGVPRPHRSDPDLDAFEVVARASP